MPEISNEIATNVLPLIDATSVASKRRQKRFVILFIIALFIAFSPSRALGLISPFIFYMGLIFYVGVRPRTHLKKYILIFILYSVAGFYYWLFLQDWFWFTNYFLFFITMSPYLVLFYDFKSILDEQLLGQLGKISLLFIVVESVYGLGQALYTFRQLGTFDNAAGDFVWGTLAPPFNQAYSGRGPMFIILISTLLIFSIAVFNRPVSLVHVVTYGLVFVCWLLASLLHSIAYFLVATGLAFVLMTIQRLKISGSARPITKRKKQYGFGLMLLGILVFIVMAPKLLSTNIGRIPYIYQNLFEISSESTFFKMRSIYSTLFLVPEDIPLQPLVGAGPGQYNSRAALMISGEYLRSPIPLLATQMHEMTEQHVIPLLKAALERGGSSLDSPNSSWLVMYGETGAIGFLIVLVIVFKALRRFLRYRSKTFPRMNLMILILLLYLVLMGLQDVYWEYVQAIFPAILALKLSYDYLYLERFQIQQQ